MIVGGPLGRQLGTEEDGDRDKTTLSMFLVYLYHLVFSVTRRSRSDESH